MSVPRSVYLACCYIGDGVPCVWTYIWLMSTDDPVLHAERILRMTTR